MGRPEKKADFVNKGVHISTLTAEEIGRIGAAQARKQIAQARREGRNPASGNPYTDEASEAISAAE